MSRDRCVRRCRPARVELALVLAALAGLACERNTTNATVNVAQPPAAEPIAATNPAPAVVPVSAPSAPASELIIGSERGLEAWSLDGARHRVISAGAALHPRWLDASTIVALAPRDARSLSAGASLQRISLADGTRSELGVVPPFACKKPAPIPDDPEGSWPYEVDLQDETDFELAPDGHLACLRLLDRNVNMASVILDVHVDLRKHKAQRWLVTGADVCPPPRGVRRGQPTSTCSGSADARATEPAPKRDYAFDMPNADGEVIQTTPQGARTALKLGLDYSPEARSPSGRWLVLGGDTVDGDYLYRRLSLLDRESGRVYPILEKPGAWPRAIEPSAGSPPTSPPTLPGPIESAVLVPGEADVRWLPLPEGEVLVVDTTIVRPGAGSFTLDGVIAR